MTPFDLGRSKCTNPRHPLGCSPNFGTPQIKQKLAHHVGRDMPKPAHVKRGHVSKSDLEEKVLWATRWYALIWNSVDPYAREPLCIVQVCFRHNPQMTLGQRMTLGGQIASGKVRSDSCKSFGAVFGALAPLVEPRHKVLCKFKPRDFC